MNRNREAEVPGGNSGQLCCQGPNTRDLSVGPPDSLGTYRLKHLPHSRFLQKKKTPRQASAIHCICHQGSAMNTAPVLVPHRKGGACRPSRYRTHVFMDPVDHKLPELTDVVEEHFVRYKHENAWGTNVQCTPTAAKQNKNCGARASSVVTSRCLRKLQMGQNCSKDRKRSNDYSLRGWGGGEAGGGGG